MKDLYNEDLIYAICDEIVNTAGEIVYKKTLCNWDGYLDKRAKDGDKKDKLTYYKNKPFYASLICTGVGRGTSSCKFHWENDVCEYTMFPVDVKDILSMNVKTSPLKGYFAIVKRGANFGIKYLGKENPDGKQ